MRMVDNQTVIPNDAQMLERARGNVRGALAQSMAFQSLPINDQKSIYLSLVQEDLAKQRESYGLSSQMATDSGADMGYKGYNPAFGADTANFKELVDSVDFPKFVADLLKAVFDANLKVMKQQTDAYIKLMKEATKSAADFIKQVKDEDAFARLAESHSDQYNVQTEKQADGSNKLVLTKPEGGKHDLQDAEVMKDLFEAKLKMAQEHRAAIREMIVIGVNRLVVESGVIEAGVDFSVKATRNSAAHHEDQNVNVTTASMSYDSPLGGIFGGPSGSIETTNTNIQINTSDKKTSDEQTATLHGKVNIKFKTDYFKLDNFLTMYSDGGTAALKPAQQGQQSQLGPARPG